MTESKRKKDCSDLNLDLEDYIRSEYSFAQKTAEHLMTEHQKLVNNFMVLNAVLYAAIFFIFRTENVKGIFSKAQTNAIIYTVLLVLVFIGTINIFKLSRLEKVWWNCNHIMNKIKDVYTQQVKSNESIIGWTQDAIKHTFQEKYDGVFFLSVLSIVFLNSLTITVAVAFVNFSLIWIIITFFVTLFCQILFYKFN